jgi:AraC-like DNA-binding protein
MGEERGLSELRPVVLRAAAGRTGRIATPVVGLWLYRHEVPPPVTQVHADGMRLGVLIQGEKVVRFEGRELRYRPGSYLVITQDSDFESQVVQASASAPYLALGIELPAEWIVDALVELEAQKIPSALESVAPWVSHLDQPMTDALFRLLNACDNALAARVLAPVYLREVVAHLLLSDAAASLRRAALRDGDQVRVQQAMAFMRDHLGRRISVDDVARHVAMSTSHFAHRFRAVARTSPIQYLKRVRLQRARLILLNEGARPAEVAPRVGYASVSHFSRDFKASFGESPGAFAARQRDAIETGPRSRASA